MSVLALGRRRGASRLGCLLLLLAVAVIGYLGVQVGEPYWRYYQLRDRMRQEARFADTRGDAEIESRLKEFADSLGLPDDAAHETRVRRYSGSVFIGTDYAERVTTPFGVRELQFHPRVEARL